MMPDHPEVSVVICTYNRPTLLLQAVNSFLWHSTGQIKFELIVVDNNSTEETRALVDGMARRDTRIRYLREQRQGNAYARNTGVLHARAPIVAFLDDDVAVKGNWLETIKNTFSQSNADFIGGKVLPHWEQRPPHWLTHRHWAPIAAVDYGEEPVSITSNNPLCLLTANIAFKRSVFERHGGFSADVQRERDRIGSLEDHEFLMRLLRAGSSGLYVPNLVVEAHVGQERMTKAYHRRWHTGHGHFYAVMRDPDWERSQLRLMGVPGHLYRQTATHAIIWFSRILRGHPDAAFAHECQLRFFGGFFRERQRQRAVGNESSKITYGQLDRK